MYVDQEHGTGWSGIYLLTIFMNRPVKTLSDV